MNNKPNEVPRIPTRHINERVVLIRYNSSKLFNKHRNDNRHIELYYVEIYIRCTCTMVSFDK